MLTPDEWLDVKELFRDEARRASHERITALEAQLHGLRGLGAQVQAITNANVHLRCIALHDAGTTLRNNLLTDLLPQLAIRALRSSRGVAANGDVLIVVGAEALRRRHLEKLAELAQRRGVQLLYMFKHLREDAAEVLGSGAAAAIFMRLGNMQEAERAAQFIGKEYKFELSQLTSSLSTGTTHTRGTNDGQSEGTTSSFATYSRSTTRSWGTTQSVAASMTRTEGSTTSRVYEYAVEPTTLQALPEWAVVLVELDRNRGGRVLKAGDCNPDLLSLDRVSLQPLTLPVRVQPSGVQTPFISEK